MDAGLRGPSPVHCSENTESAFHEVSSQAAAKLQEVRHYHHAEIWRERRQFAVLIYSHLLFVNEQTAWNLAVGDAHHLLAVARKGSLSGAARALGVGHVTVRRRIALLEKRLGVTLLNRTPDGLATTSAGDAVPRQYMAIERAALDLERTAAGRDFLLAGSVG